MEICKETSCVGCMICAEVCPKSAIDYQVNSQGFWYPHIEEDKCIGCKKCEKVCPVHVNNKFEKTKDIVAAWNKDKDRRLTSTSGGVFYPIAKNILDCGGIVYGAALDKSNSVYHARIESVNALQLLSGSKYTQSNTEGCYKKVKDDLLLGRRVLFSGTPCQVSALKSFLGEEYENLICIDIVCHGVPSPKVFSDYLEYISMKYSSIPVKINFRYKKPCWSVFSMKIDFEDGNTYIASKFKDPYLYFFLVGGGAEEILHLENLASSVALLPQKGQEILLWEIFGEYLQLQRSRRIKRVA